MQNTEKIERKQKQILYDKMHVNAQTQTHKLKMNAYI